VFELSDPARLDGVILRFGRALLFLCPGKEKEAKRNPQKR